MSKDDLYSKYIVDPDAPGGAVVVYGIGALVYGMVGAMLGVIALVSGQSWHQVLICGAVGAVTGFVTMVL